MKARQKVNCCICLIFMLMCCSPAKSDFGLYKLYGFYDFRKYEMIARYPFVHALILHLHQTKDHFVHAMLNLVVMAQENETDLNNVLMTEEKLQNDWLSEALIKYLKQTLYRDTWWLDEELPE